MCDGNIDNIKVSGGGEGWSIKYEKALTNNQTKIRIFLVTIILMIEMLFLSRFNKPKKWENIDTIEIIVTSITYLVGFAWALSFKLEKFQIFIDDLYKQCKEKYRKVSNSWK